MSTFNLAPNGAALSSTGSWGPVGGTVPALFSDGNLGTYVVKSSAGATDKITYPCSDLSLPANEFVASIAATASLKSSTRAVAVYPAEWYSTSDVSLAPGLAFSDTTTQHTGQVGASGVVSPKTGTPWTNTSVNALALALYDTATSSRVGSQGQFQEIGLLISTASIPLAPTVSAPSGGQLTVTPSITWTHNDVTTATITTRALTSNVVTITTSAAHGFLVGNDVTVAMNVADAVFDGTYKITAVTSTTFSYAVTHANVVSASLAGTATIGDGSAQSYYQVTVFSAAQYGVGGFDPASSPSTWTSGQVTSSTTSIVPSALGLSTGYRAYVRTGKPQGTSSIVWSPWAFSAFTTPSAQPSPTISASWDTTNQRTTLTIGGLGNLLSDDAASFETSTGGFTNNGNTTLARTTAQFDTGIASLALTSVAAGGMSVYVPSIPIAPSAAYIFSAKSKAATVARSVSVQINWYDSSGAFISSSTGSAANNSTSAWTTYSATGTSPSNAAFAFGLFNIAAAGAAGEVHWFDTAALQPGSSVSWSSGGASFAYTLTRTVGGVTTALRPPFTADLAQRLTFYDYEVPRGVSATYNVQQVATFATGVIPSATVTSGAVTTTSDNAWWLKSVTSPSLNKSVRVTSTQPPTESRVENLGVFRLDGRTDPVVVAGQTFGDDITFQIYTSTAAEFEAVKALVVAQTTLLLQEPFTDSTASGIQRYIRIIDRNWTKEGVPGSPRRVFSITAIQVGQGY